MSSRRAVEAAKAVLAKCAATDPWFPKMSHATIQAWAEHFDRTTIPTKDLLEAVVVFYSRGGDGRPGPGDIIITAKAIRQDQFMRQPLQDIHAHWDAIDQRLAGRIEEAADAMSLDRAIEPKYVRREANPLTIACPYEGCRAIAGKRCTSGGQRMTGYHPSRLDAAKGDRQLPPGGTPA